MTDDQQRAILSLTEAKGILRERGENYCAILIADAIEIITALRAAPEGFVLVPVEPTPEMLCAGERAHWQKQSDMLCPAPTEFYEDCGGPMGYAYLAMLAVRPQEASDA